jgi:hypothetical protein
MIRVLATLGAIEVSNLCGLRLYASDGPFELHPWLPALSKTVIAVLPDPLVTMDVCDAPEGRRWLIHTAHATYRLIPRKGRIWRMKRMRPLPPMPANAGELLPLSRMLRL